MKTLYLFDSFALIYRAYFAMIKNPLINSKGQNVSAISGYLNNILEIQQKFNPTILACCFDAPVITDRQLEHEFYKANRQETPEDIKMSVPYIKAIVKAMNLPLLEVEGFEADDIMGGIAKQAELQGYKVFLVTPDKDMCQLVSDNIFIHRPPYMGRPYEVLGVKEVCDKWEIDQPTKVIDILGLWGDAVDNIPGIPGVGEKTAKTLVQQFGSIESLLENTDKLKGKLKENVENFKEQALISKKLATIVTDIPVHFDEESFMPRPYDKETLNSLFVELEFRTLGKKILGEDYSVNTPKAKPSSLQGTLFGDFTDTDTIAQEDKGRNATNIAHEYHAILTAKDFEKYIQKIYSAKKFAFDTETTGLDALQCNIVGFSLSVEAHEACYIPLNKIEKLEVDKILILLKALLADETLTVVGQNLKFDLLFLRTIGIDIHNSIEDTMLAHYILEPDLKHNMNYLSETYLGYTPISIETLIGGRGKKQGNMNDVPLEKITEYAAEDADITLQLHHHFEKSLDSSSKLHYIYSGIECPLIPVLADMEFEGVKIDKEFLQSYSTELGENLLQLTQEIYTSAGTTFNINSPQQLGEILFDRLKIKYTEKKTKTHQYATGEDVLQKIIQEHSIVPMILQYREFAKLKSTYVDALPSLIHPTTGRIHTTFNQAVASTGRLSSINPNLQNIPIRTDYGRKIRGAFRPRNSEHTLLSADYSQIELRIIASLSGDERMMDAFAHNVDIHTATAAAVYGVAEKDVDATMRRNAKSVNFGIIYGISAFGLSQNLGISRTEAATLIQNYFSQYPQIKTFMDKCIAEAKKNGYAETLLGRRRYLRDINSSNPTVRGFAERNAINAPIQGTAADMIKIAMINVYKSLEKYNLRSKMILQVHDELLFDVFTPELNTLQEIVRTNMQNALPLSVPVIVEIGDGDNWLDAH